MRKLMTKLGGGALLALASTPALAEDATGRPVADALTGSQWVWAVLFLAAIAVLLSGYRTHRVRHGPHGPRSPTPRGP